jgi:hypothetical protein
VLDNVIFVHQEESNWPLADGATIKKKFDEIFAATKYTKVCGGVRGARGDKGCDRWQEGVRGLRVGKQGAWARVTQRGRGTLSCPCSHASSQLTPPLTPPHHHRPQALESLRKLRLEKNQEAKEMRLKLETLKRYICF